MTGLNMYRLVAAFGHSPNAQDTMAYLFDMSYWETMALPVLQALMIWVGDALVVNHSFKPQLNPAHSDRERYIGAF